MSKKDIIKRKKGEVIYEAKLDGKEIKSNKLKIVLVGVIIIVLFILLFI